MYRVAIRFVRSLVACATICMCAAPAHADDTEIFFSQTVSSGDANLMLILDTSGSMGDTATQATRPYDSTLTYKLQGTGSGWWDTDACQAGRIYYRPNDPLNTTPPSSCADSDLSYFNTSDNFCYQAVQALAYGGSYSGRPGFYQGTFIRWGGRNSNRDWNATLEVSRNAAAVECKEDAGIDGQTKSNGTINASNPYPRPGPTSDGVGRWGSAGQSWWSDSNVGREYVLWSANYIAYTHAPPIASSQTRMEVVKQAAINLVNTVNHMNVGLMRYDTSGNGGMVMAPAKPIDDPGVRTNLISLINNFHEAGNTPLSETLFEAYRYFAGGEVKYGNNSKTCSVAVHGGNCPSGSLVNSPSPAASRIPAQSDGAKYDSPADQECQNNYIVYLTDGLPNSDNNADSDIDALPGTTCDARGPSGASPDSAGRCLSALTRYMGDTQNTDLRDDVNGHQTVKTYFIGFGDDFAGQLNDSFAYLDTAARASGGRAFQATGLADLEGAFNSIVNEVVDTNATFTSPTVAVNAFNRTQTLSDLYVSVFQPKLTRHWPGNLKRYKVQNSQIVDANGQLAVGTNGFFKSSAKSVWSADTDGYDVTKGGAASKLPGSGSRVVYTYIGSGTPSGGQSLRGSTNTTFDTSNALLTDAVFGIGGAGDPTRDDLIDWARGTDVQDQDPVNGNNSEARHVMGDPIHAQPTIVIYGGTTGSPDINDALVFLPTNDGYVHAIDPTSGTELWSFIPQEALRLLKGLYQNPNSAKQYILDGEIRVLKYDINGDGIVDPLGGDRVILYFGQGRGGKTYYALDVTIKDSPKFLWSIDDTSNAAGAWLPGAGQAWSPPTIARVNIQGATQNSQKLVLIIGGGYDVGEDGAAYVSTAATGNRIYIVDALTGRLLWSAGPTVGSPAPAGAADLQLSRMDHSFPSKVTVLDTNQDGYADRMYVGDTAAQLWRFDIKNGNEVGSLVAGGVIASLGNHDLATKTEQNSRRFYNAPDATAMQIPGMAPFMNLALGSGYRGHPLNTVNQDRFYVVRDYKPFTAMTQSEYNSFTVINDGDLVDVTTDVTPTIPSNAPGWKIRLDQPGDTWVGEKVLSSANTFKGTIFYTTYRPSTGAAQNTCSSNLAGTGKNRSWAISALDGSPVNNPRATDSDGDGQIEDDEIPDPRAEDRFSDLGQGGIAPEISFLFPEPNKLLCLSGVEVLSVCTNFNSRIKTYWRDATAN